MLRVAGSGILIARLSEQQPIHLVGQDRDGLITSACGRLKLPREQWTFSTYDSPIDEAQVCGLCLKGELLEEHAV